MTSDLRVLLKWWDTAGRQAGRGLLESIQSFGEHLVHLNRKPSTILRISFSIERVLTALNLGNPMNRNLTSVVPPAERARSQRRHSQPPEATPFGWNKIKKCVETADPSCAREASFIAALLVLYEAMATIDQIFGHWQHQEWHVQPARRSDVRRISDGSGLLSLQPSRVMPQGREAYLSPLTIKWLERSFHGRQDIDGPLFLSSRGKPMNYKGWERGARKIASCAGLTAKELTSVSPRLGMAKDFLEAGASVPQVCRIGGWADKSCVIRLLDIPTETYSVREFARRHGRVG